MDDATVYQVVERDQVELDVLSYLEEQNGTPWAIRQILAAQEVAQDA